MGVRRRIPDMIERWQERARIEGTRIEARAVVDRWNAALAAGTGALWSPTIRAAVLADMPWLDVYCPGCRTSRAIDIRTIDRHPLASVGSLVLGLRCTWCGGAGPMPRLIGLHRLPARMAWEKSG
jgi:hypothetical protein